MACVTRSVQFNSKPGLWAEEIDDPITEWMLPAELQIRDLAVAQA
jgi:hypothetical protein